MKNREILSRSKYIYKNNLVYILTAFLLIFFNTFAFSYEIKIKPIFDEVYGFKEGLAPVKLNEKWGYINTDGEFVIQPKYEQVTNFFNEIARVQVSEGEGFIDKLGNFIIPPIYEKQEYIIYSFNDYLAAVKLNGKYGYINKKGNTVIPFFYENALDFSESNRFYTIVKLNGKKGIIDQQGNFIIPNKYENLLPVSDGLYQVSFSGEDGLFTEKFIDISDRIIIQPDKNKRLCSYFREGLCEYQEIKTGKYGYINLKSEIVIEPKFDNADSFNNGLARVAVTINGIKKIGYIDRFGKYVLPPIYEDGIFIPHPDMIEVKQGGWGLVDLKGNFIIPPKFEMIGVPDDSKYILFKENGKYGFLTLY